MTGGRLGGSEYGGSWQQQQPEDSVDGGGNVEQYYNNLVQASNDYYGKTGGDVCDSSRYSE